MATTSPDNIRTPDAGDQYALVQDMGAMADTVQLALNRRANAYTGTSAQRGAFTTAPESTLWTDTTGNKNTFVRRGGAWLLVSYGDSQNVLWSGAWYLSQNQTVQLSAPVSAQPSGIILAWSAGTSGAGTNNDWNYSFIPKIHTRLRSGSGINLPLKFGTAAPMHKYVYVSDGSLTGHVWNTQSPNTDLVLREVIGV